MSDLVQKLRDNTKFYHSDCELKMECAARIEELEAQRDELVETLKWYHEALKATAKGEE